MEKRSNPRVEFSRGIETSIVAIDGTWSRICKMHDVSEEGAKLAIEGSLDGLQVKEFFLVLSKTGASYRRCELAWVNGDHIGVRFLGRKGIKR